MPGYVIHLAVASKIIERMNINAPDFVDAFLIGNIIPDAMERNAKKESHFWDDETYKNLNRIPNLKLFQSKYGNSIREPFVLGYYTHLLLDNLFVKNYWREHFLMLDDNLREENAFHKVKKVKQLKSGDIYDRESFFSDQLYYGDYDRINPYIFERYPFICIKHENVCKCLEKIPVEEVDDKEIAAKLYDMIDKVNSLYDQRAGLEKEELRIFDLEHIYNLMDAVVDNVCENMTI